MIVTDKAAVEGTSRDASGPGWRSLRLLVDADGMGFSMTETTLQPGAVLKLHYKHHIEACYCIGGRGSVVDLQTGATHEIQPGVLYAPNAHDPHQLHVDGDEPMQLICVFSPALKGDEVHGPDGSYTPSDPV